MSHLPRLLGVLPSRASSTPNFLRLTLCFGLVILLSVAAFAQDPAASTSATPGTGAQINGTVNVDGKAAAGIDLLLITSDDMSRPALNLGMGWGTRDVKARAVTDSQGRYAFHELSAANYVVFPFSPTLAPPPNERTFTSAGQVLSVQPDETIDGVDFSLSKGGVITGKVTRADGQPAIEVSLSISPADNKSTTVDLATGSPFHPVSTDDRGIYRAYGLAPGRYTVCAQPRRTSGYALNPAFCYPAGSDKTHSKVIEIAGDEISNVDIAIAVAAAGYNATGRAVDDDGNPVAGADYYYYGISDEGRPSSGMSFGTGTGPSGDFKITGLLPGQYGVTLQLDGDSGSYCDPAIFQISDGDVSNILVKVHTGSSISGVVTIEGSQDPDALAQLPNVQLFIFSHSPGPSPIAMPVSVNPAPDGSFQAGGISPGQLSIQLNAQLSPPNFSLLRVEQNGIPQPQGIQATAGQQVTGVQVFLSYGMGSIRGLVTIAGGAPPPGSLTIVTARLVSGASPGPAKMSIADARGRFEIDGLSDGQYQVTATVNSAPGSPARTEQTVTVNAGQPTDVTLTLNTGKQN